MPVNPKYPVVEKIAFARFEQMVDFFIGRTGIFFPKLSQGQEEFFKGFSRWFSQSGDVIRTGLRQSFILPEPSMGLAFPNAFDVLASIIPGQFYKNKKNKVIELLEIFGLGEDYLTQPVSTLSGGETLQLNFAKVFAQINQVSSLVACNPLFWLNSQNYKFWDYLVSSYIDVGNNVTVAAMAGDPVLEEPVPAATALPPLSPLKFSLEIKNARVFFPEIQFPVVHKASSLEYFTENDEILKCSSPVLITGQNGAGKSVFARVLAGVVGLNRGLARCQNETGATVARLLFQESTSQMFAQNPDIHRNNVFACCRKSHDAARAIYESLCADIFAGEDCFKTGTVSGYSLLEAKIGIIAERLATSPALLILDEPGWGLSSLHTQKLVYYTTRRAHALNTAVAIISHQPHWLGFAAGKLNMVRLPSLQVLVEYEDLA